MYLKVMTGTGVYPVRNRAVKLIQGPFRSIQGPFEALPEVSSNPPSRDFKRGSRATERAAQNNI